MKQAWESPSVQRFPLILFGLEASSRRAGAEMHRRTDLQEAESRVRIVCHPAEARRLLSAAPPYNGTSRRTEVLNAARRMVLAGCRLESIENLLVRGYGPETLAAAAQIRALTSYDGARRLASLVT